jgi:hypothetical protein
VVLIYRNWFLKYDTIIAPVYGREIITKAEEDSVILTDEDGTTFVLWYYMYVNPETRRKNVSVIDIRMYHWSQWFRDYLRKARPDIDWPELDKKNRRTWGEYYHRELKAPEGPIPYCDRPWPTYGQDINVVPYILFEKLTNREKPIPIYTSFGLPDYNDEKKVWHLYTWGKYKTVNNGFLNRIVRKTDEELQKPGPINGLKHAALARKIIRYSSFGTERRIEPFDFTTEFKSGDTVHLHIIWSTAYARRNVHRWFGPDGKQVHYLHGEDNKTVNQAWPNYELPYYSRLGKYRVELYSWRLIEVDVSELAGVDAEKLDKERVTRLRVEPTSCLMVREAKKPESGEFRRPDLYILPGDVVLAFEPAAKEVESAKKLLGEKDVAMHDGKLRCMSAAGLQKLIDLANDRQKSGKNKFVGTFPGSKIIIARPQPEIVREFTVEE